MTSPAPVYLEELREVIDEFDDSLSLYEVLRQEFPPNLSAGVIVQPKQQRQKKGTSKKQRGSQLHSDDDLDEEAKVPVSISDDWDLLVIFSKMKFSPKAKFFPPGTQGYKDCMRSYFWSSSRQNPELVFQPAMPNDIAEVFRIIQLTEIGFAVKAASHIAPFGFNSTKNILIDLSLFRDIQYYPQSQTIDVGPGLLWTDIYDYFETNKIPRNVIGATSCQGVGVAGFLLGGGYGHKANQYGLAMDHICAMELVTPTGDSQEITEDPTVGNLSWALRGGGNNFGVVTKWTLNTVDQPTLVYFQRFIYDDPDVFAQVEDAVWDFAQKVDKNRKANVETKFEWIPKKGKPVPSAIAECYYDGTPPTDFFQEFEKIPHDQRLRVGTDKYAEFIKMLPTRRQTYRWGVALGREDLPDTFRGRYTCVMLSKYTRLLIQKIVEVATKYAQYLPAHSGLQFYPDIWPASSLIFEKSVPGAWPHDKDHPNFPLPIRCLWADKKYDGFWLGKLNDMTAEIIDVAIKADCTTATADSPMYYNLALDGTQPQAIYTKDYETLVTVRGEVDPYNLMKRTGGFRIGSSQDPPSSFDTPVDVDVKGDTVIRKRNILSKGLAQRSSAVAPHAHPSVIVGLQDPVAAPDKFSTTDDEQHHPYLRRYQDPRQRGDDAPDANEDQSVSEPQQYEFY